MDLVLDRETASQVRKSRNQELRAAIRAAFPGVSFTVRNGAGGVALVVWYDGPTEHQVSTVAATIRSHPSGTRWSVTCHRHATAYGLALAFWRARAAGRPGYTPPLPPEQRRGSMTGASVRWVDESTDLSVPATDHEEVGCRLLLRFANLEPDTRYKRYGDDGHTPRWELGRLLHEYGDAIDATFTDQPT